MLSFRRTLLPLLVAAPFTACGGAPNGESEPVATASQELVDAAFTVVGPARKCIDVGGTQFQYVGHPAYFFECNGTTSQHLRVVEKTDGSRDVKLRNNAYCIGVRGGVVTPGAALELQTCNGSAAQRFALDGDSILVGTQTSGRVNRAYVVEVERGRAENRTPLVVGVRNLDDAEFWSFKAVDGSDRGPTSGFVRITTTFRQLREAVAAATWGTVIEIPNGVTIAWPVNDATPFVAGEGLMKLRAGVTVRSNRRGTDLGGLISLQRLQEDIVLFEMVEPDVRVTGLRLQGPNPSTDKGLAISTGIKAKSALGAIIDHNEMYDWTGAAVTVEGYADQVSGSPEHECAVGLTYPRPELVRVHANHLHHNRREDSGYGVVMSGAAFARLEGNAFAWNRHAIAADGSPGSGYHALYNLTLDGTARYGFWNAKQQDFDMHGQAGASNHSFRGGAAGDTLAVEYNTFLGTDRPNIELRGTPCQAGYARYNVSVQSHNDMIKDGDNTNSSRFPHIDNLTGMNNPTDGFAVGDFDADGRDDLFLATGVAWFYSSGGQQGWRYLNRASERTGDLRFGDFDGDGRTDVMAYHMGAWDVSWAGNSPWDRINGAAESFSEYRIGDFDGDGRADVLCPNGYEWLVSWGGRSSWQSYAKSTWRSADLRFGDFDGDKKTDVFGVVEGNWRIIRYADRTWKTLRPTLTTSVAGLVVADFDRDGRADVADSVYLGSRGWSWRISRGGTADWTSLQSSGGSLPLTSRPIGDFDGDGSADVMVWSGLYMHLSPGGSQEAYDWSWNDLR